MKLSLVVSVEETEFTAVAVRMQWQQGIQLAGALGYEGVELAVRDPAAVDAQELRQVVRGAEVGVAAVGTGQAYLRDGLSLTSEDAAVRQRAIERLTGHLHLAAPFGADVIVGLVRGRLQGGVSVTEGRLIGSLEQLLSLAERLSVRLLLEPINRYETDYLLTVDEALGVIRKVSSRRLGVLADLFHMNIEEASIEHALRRCGSDLGHVHIADSNRRAPGLGHLDFVSILGVLAEVGYRGYLSAEILPMPTPEEAARQTVRYLRPLLTRVQVPRTSTSQEKRGMP